jgi:hypothetical protein
VIYDAMVKIGGMGEFFLGQFKAMRPAFAAAGPDASLQRK